MEWTRTEHKKPKFGELVLVWCKIYGRFLATYEEIGLGYGNWQDTQGSLGIPPPIFWAKLPPNPEQD